MRRCALGLMLVLLLGGSVFSEELPVLAQIAPGMREGPGTMGRGQPSAMPMQKVSEVVKQMADHLASGKKLGPGKAKRLRALADQLVAAARQMSEGMGGGMMGGGMMGGAMMGRGSEQMAEISSVLDQISHLLRAR